MSRARQIQEEIARLLMSRWDPIGVRGNPSCADEYDMYVSGIHRLLVDRAEPAEIAQHLVNIEVESMGMPPGPRGREAHLPLAKSLLAIDLSLDND